MIIEGLSPGPLPPPKAIEHKFQTQDHSNAYTSVYNLHQRVLGDEASVIRARVLGFLLILTTNDTVRAEVVSTVVSCSNDAALHDLGEVYMDFFIRPCKFPLSNIASQHSILTKLIDYSQEVQDFAYSNFPKSSQPPFF